MCINNNSITIINAFSYFPSSCLYFYYTQATGCLSFYIITYTIMLYVCVYII